MTKPIKLQRIVIIGAGPCGILLALHLLQRVIVQAEKDANEKSKEEDEPREEAYHVSIFERRPDPRTVPPSTRRTYPISLQKRGLTAIRSIPGLLEAMERDDGGAASSEQKDEKGGGVPGPVAVWQVGNAMHSKNGKVRLNKRSEAALLLDRNAIVVSMLNHLEKMTRECSVGADRYKLDVRFECSFGGFVDEDDRQAQRLQDGLGSTIRIDPAAGEGEEPGRPLFVPYDRLVAADGAQSAVRSALVSRRAMGCDVTYTPDKYRSLFVPMAAATAHTPSPSTSPTTPADSNPNTDAKAEATVPKEPHHLAPDLVHTWLLSNEVRVILCPNGSGYLHGVIIFGPDNDPIAKCPDAHAVIEYFRSECPLTVGKLMTLPEAEALWSRKPQSIVTVKCDRMAVGTDIVLLGDAAHAVSASVGQGCNSALADVRELCATLDTCGGDWDEALPEFSRRRLPEAYALRDLSDYTMPRTKLMWLEFFLRVTIGRVIRRWFPWLLSPLPMELIMEGDMAYTEVLKKTSGWINRVKKSMPQA